MGVGCAAGKNKAEEAAREAISSPLLETSINGAHGVLVNVTGSTDIGLDEVETAANHGPGGRPSRCHIIFGATFDENMEDEIRVTVIATGFDEKVMNAKSTPPPRRAPPRLPLTPRRRLPPPKRTIPTRRSSRSSTGTDNYIICA
ncbi:MAG: hypothetical protein ACLUNZ_10830 [Evtepia sp.]